MEFTYNTSQIFQARYLVCTNCTNKVSNDESLFEDFLKEAGVLTIAIDELREYISTNDDHLEEDETYFINQGIEKLVKALNLAGDFISETFKNHPEYY